MKSTRQTRKYPRIMELALTAGKWSVLAGGAVAMIGASGCEEIADRQDVALDVTQDFVQLDGLPYPEDLDHPDQDVQEEIFGTIDTGAFVDVPTMGLPPLDQVEPDVYQPDDFVPGVVIDVIVDTNPGYELSGEDVPWSPDDGTDVIDPVDASELPPSDAVEVDPGAPLPGEPPIDVFPGDVIEPDQA